MSYWVFSSLKWITGQNVFKLDILICVYSFVPDLLSLYFKRYILQFNCLVWDHFDLLIFFIFLFFLSYNLYIGSYMHHIYPLCVTVFMVNYMYMYDLQYSVWWLQSFKCILFSCSLSGRCCLLAQKLLWRKNLEEVT